VQARPVRRLPIALVAAGVVAFVDLVWKSAAIAAAHGALAVDTPSSLVRPAATVIALPIALVAVATVPGLCLPGALLALAGVSGNLASLAIWHAVPDPLSVAVAGGQLHFNLADLCIWSGCVVLLLSAVWAIWRIPAERFA
jgi:hypothetical protein